MPARAAGAHLLLWRDIGTIVRHIAEMRSRLPQGTIVRAMNPIGTYWRESVLTDGAAYVVKPDLIFTAVHFKVSEADYYSEFEEPLPEEIALLAALELSVGWDRGRLTQYPAYNSVRDERKTDLRAAPELDRLELLLRDALRTDKPTPNTPPDPPGRYQYFHWPNPTTIQTEILSNIDPSDDLLIRRLGTWLKAGMLSLHPMFSEEANYPLCISLDASLNLVLEHLESEGTKNQSTKDAQEFIHRAFGEESSGLRYFEDYYEDRIRTMHPKNRFGVTPVAPIKHCDFYCLHMELREVYRYFLLGEVLDPQIDHDTQEFWERFRAEAVGS
jgi:hypothetical protein